MKIAVISDIHANFCALDAVLQQIHPRNISSIVCLGDVATLGVQPNEVLEKLMSLDCTVIFGNHDAAILRPDNAAQYQIAEPVLPALSWAINKLKNDDLDYIKSFKNTAEINMAADLKLLCYHGSPRSNIENILAVTPADELDAFFRGYRAEIFAGGHTHIQMLRQHNGFYILNPGSVGQPFVRTPNPGESPQIMNHAEYAIVSLDARDIKIELCRVTFDVIEYLKAIRKSSNPLKDWLLAKYENTVEKS